MKYDQNVGSRLNLQKIKHPMNKMKVDAKDKLRTHFDREMGVELIAPKCKGKRIVRR